MKKKKYDVCHNLKSMTEAYIPSVSIEIQL